MKPRRAFGLLALMVGILAAVCGVWLRIQRQQYERNRQLIAALEHNDPKTALALVNAGAGPNTRLAPASAPTFKLLLDHLLRRNNSPEADSPTAFMFACGTFPVTMPHALVRLPLPWIEEDVPLLQAMLAHGADVHTRKSGNSTALHYAADKRLWHTVKLLLQHGADVNAQDVKGWTPLMYAVHHDTPDMAHLLLAQGANPNIQNEVGDTALYYAVQSPIAASLLSDLLAHGADSNLQSTKGYTLLEVAQRLERPDLVRLLKREAK